MTIGTFPFLKEFAGCRISDRPKGMLKLCHFICSALLTIFLTLSTALLLESGSISALCLSLILHFFWHALLHIESLNMLVSLRGAASLWIKDVSTKMKTYTINHWYAWCWSCERWELMKLSYSSCKHHRQNIVPPVLAASHRQTYGDNMSSSESSDVSLTIHRSKLPTGDHPRMAMWVWNCRFSTQINHQIYLTKIGFKPLDFGGAHLHSLLPTEIYKQSLVSDFSQLRNPESTLAASISFHFCCRGWLTCMAQS